MNVVGKMHTYFLDFVLEKFTDDADKKSTG